MAVGSVVELTREMTLASIRMAGARRRRDLAIVGLEIREVVGHQEIGARRERGGENAGVLAIAQREGGVAAIEQKKRIKPVGSMSREIEQGAAGGLSEVGRNAETTRDIAKVIEHGKRDYELNGVAAQNARQHRVNELLTGCARSACFAAEHIADEDVDIQQDAERTRPRHFAAGSGTMCQSSMFDGL